MKLNERFPAAEIELFDGVIKSIIEKSNKNNDNFYNNLCEAIATIKYGKAIQLLLKKYPHWSSEVCFRFFNYFRQTPYYIVSLLSAGDIIHIAGDAKVINSRVKNVIVTLSYALANEVRSQYYVHDDEMFSGRAIVPLKKQVANCALIVSSTDILYPVENIVRIKRMTGTKSKVYEKGKAIEVEKFEEYTF